VEIDFATSRLARTLNNERELVKKYGSTGARKIRTRLAQLDAAETLADMRHLPGRCHELTEDRKGQLAVDVEHPQRLIFVPTNNPPPRRPDGGLSWEGVRAITIIEIHDYH